MLYGFQGNLWIGCPSIGDFTEVSFMNWCACLFIRVVACISAQDLQGLLIDFHKLIGILRMDVSHRLIGVFTMVGCFFLM